MKEFIMEWSFVKELDNPNAVKGFAKSKGYDLPSALYTMLESENAGYPNQSIFDTDAYSGRQFKCLFSYNEGDAESIFKYWPVIKRSEGLYPIGSDCGGNIVYYDIAAKKYILIDHESGQTEVILESSNPELFVLAR